MIYALIQNNIIEKIEVDLTDEEVQERFTHYQQVIDITNEITVPGVGWIFNGHSFEAPKGSDGKVITTITRLAFMNRLTDAENIAILVYMDNASAPYRYPVKMLMNKLNAATFIDLKRSDTISGVGLLVAAGIITSDRANTILNTVPNIIEIYKG